MFYLVACFITFIFAVPLYGICWLGYNLLMEYREFKEYRKEKHNE